MDIAKGSSHVPPHTPQLRINSCEGKNKTRKRFKCKGQHLSIFLPLLGTPSQPVQVELLPPHTPHASAGLATEMTTEGVRQG